jgi:uncharacterized protein YbjT (DUF2867 family)
VTGANGAAGRAILRRAARDAASTDLVAIVRSERAAADLASLAARARIMVVSYADPAALAAAFAGASAVIHLVGILVERPGATYENAHVDTTRAVGEAAKRAGVAKVVLVSAVGADARSPNRYWRTKAEAEALVRETSHTILRVPMLLGPDTEAATALRKRLAARLVPLLDGGRTRHRPLAVDDLARAALSACDPGVARDRTLELVGPTLVSEREILLRAARQTGRRVRIIPVPSWTVRVALAMIRRAAGPGLSSDALEVLTTDTRADPARAIRDLAITLTALDDMIRASVSP